MIFNFIKQNLALIVVLIVSGALRFYKLEERFVFGFNEEYQATLAQSIVEQFHIIWIGVSAAHLEFYTGPFFTYATAFWLYLSNSDPLVTGIVSVILGIIMTFLVYYLGYIVFSKKTGLIAALLYACSPFFIFFDQKYWNPTPNIVISLLIILVTFYVKKYPALWISFFALFGSIFHADLAVLPMVFPGLFIFMKNIRKIPGRIIILSITAFIILYSPLLVFDYFHNFSNLTTPFRLKEITSKNNFAATPLNHVFVLSNALTRMWYLDPSTESTDESLSTCDPLAFGLGYSHEKYPNDRTIPPIILQILFFAASMIFVVMLLREKDEKAKLIGIYIVVFLIFFLLFPGGTFEYYLLSILPLFAYMPGYFISKTKSRNRFLISVFILIVIVLGLFTIMTAKDEYGLKNKKWLISQVSDIIKGRTFELRERGVCHGLEGWRYLFNVYGVDPTRSSIDPTLGWIYPNKLKNEKVDFEVIIAEDRSPLKLDNVHLLDPEKADSDLFELVDTLRAGGFIVYIYDISLSGSVWD